jgi:hypothetical protein
MALACRAEPIFLVEIKVAESESIAELGDGEVL